MSEGIGSYLQELRTAKRWSTSQLAQKAGIRRATLSEWQAGKRQPCLPELEAVLNALSATDAQKRKAQEQLHTPTNLLRLREEQEAQNRELVEIAGLAPHGGDLLRGLRLRKGWTQTTLAEKMRVSQGTVARWERSESWPDMQMLHTLCFLLGAREEELTVLTKGRFTLTAGQVPLDAETIQAQLQVILHTRFSPSEYALAELRLLNLMAHAWSLAAKRSTGRLLLAEVATEYTEHLFMQRQFGECRRLATRTLDLYSDLRQKDWRTDRAALWLAESLAECGGQQGIDNAISLLQQWLSETDDAVYVGWILRDLAKFQAMRGKMDKAVTLGREAVERTALATGSEGYDYYYRRHDLARILNQAGRAREAQEVAGESDLHPYFMLVRAETCQAMGKPEAAHLLAQELMTTLENPAQTITQPEVTFFSPVVGDLSEQIV